MAEVTGFWEPREKLLKLKVTIMSYSLIQIAIWIWSVICMYFKKQSTDNKKKVYVANVSLGKVSLG